VRCGPARLDFARQARPQADEDIAEGTQRLFGLCQHFGVNHLISAGSAINWCPLMSPGGMLDVSRHGVMCSAPRQAVTAVEDKETARREPCKAIALWCAAPPLDPGSTWPTSRRRFAGKVRIVPVPHLAARAA
jgi:hypothetical protein